MTWARWDPVFRIVSKCSLFWSKSSVLSRIGLKWLITKSESKSLYCPVFKSQTSSQIFWGSWPVIRLWIHTKLETPGRSTGSKVTLVRRLLDLYWIGQVEFILNRRIWRVYYNLRFANLINLFPFSFLQNSPVALMKHPTILRFFKKLR